MVAAAGIAYFATMVGISGALPPLAAILLGLALRYGLGWIA